MVFFVRITVNQSHLRPICKSTKFNPKIQRTIYSINFQRLRLHVLGFIRTVVLFESKKINAKREKYSQKKLLKKIKDKFKDYPAVAEEVEKRGLTAEQIHEDPTILLEILDKSLQ